MNICENQKVVRKVGVIDAKMASKSGLLATGPGVKLTPGQHALNLHHGGPTPYQSASTLKNGAAGIGGVPIRIDVAEFIKSGGKFIDHSEILDDLQRMVANNEISQSRLDKWLKVQPLEGEVLLKGDISASAVETKGARVLKGCGKGAMVVGVFFTVKDLAGAAGESIETGCVAPIAAETVRQVGGWGGAWLGCKAGAAVGAAWGSPSGVGAAATALGGGFIGGIGGYFAGDSVADQIHEN